MSKHHDDGIRPSVKAIRGHLALGNYGPEVEGTVRALLTEIDFLTQELNALEGQMKAGS